MKKKKKKTTTVAPIPVPLIIPRQVNKKNGKCDEDKSQQVL